MAFDPYEILEIEPGATDEEIRRAWRELTLVWHPDRFENDSELRAKAEERLKRINQAYQMLQRGENRRSRSRSSSESRTYSGGGRSGPSEPPVWRVRDSKQEVSTTDPAEILRWIRRGNVSGDDEVLPPGASRWHPLRETPPFSVALRARLLRRAFLVLWGLLLVTGLLLKRPALVTMAVVFLMMHLFSGSR